VTKGVRQGQGTASQLGENHREKRRGLVRSLVVGTKNKEEEGLDRDTQREKDLTERKRIESEKRERQRGVEQ
jgi:hypothetical protein